MGDLGLNIVQAHICTEKGAALNTFSLLDKEGSRLTHEDWDARIMPALKDAALFSED